MKGKPRINEGPYLFKGGPGKYGKGAKQSTEDDFIELKSDANIPSLPYTSSISIYHRKNKPKFNYGKTLNFLFVLCFSTLITLKFFVNSYFVTTHEKSFEDLLSKLCFAFIGSYMFYNIVTKTTDRLKKKEAYAVICGLNDSIIHHGKNVRKWLLLGAGKEDNYNLNAISKEDFRIICSEVNLSTIPSNYQSNISSLIINDGVKKIKNISEKVFTYMPFLESELIHQINKILNSKFSIFIILIPFKKNSNLKEFSLELIEFFELINKLEIYNNKLKKKYLKNNYERIEL